MKRFVILFFTLVLLSCLENDVPRPRLIVFISIDQLRPDLLTRFDHLFDGGYRWLIDHGIWFNNTHHDHTYTATAAGHFTIGSGQNPASVGIFGNDWYDRKLNRSVYAVEDASAKIINKPNSKGKSYKRFNTTGLGDWLKKSNPASKVISIGGKDRSTILTAGKHPDIAVWYNWDGSFVTSDYYVDQNPRWLDSYNAQLNVISYRDSLWTRSLEPELYEKLARTDNFSGENDEYLVEPYSPILPIGFDSTYNDARVLSDIGGTPWLDRLTINLASLAVEEEALGKDGNTDILFLILSASDWIGHNYGPFSQEAMDNQIKLDGNLNRFLNKLDESVGLDNILFVMTSDHGACILPEYLKEKFGINAGRISQEARESAFDAVQNECQAKFGASNIVIRSGLGFWYDYNLVKEKNISIDELDKIVASHFDEIEGIDRIVFKNEFKDPSPSDTILWRMHNSYYHDQGPDGVLLVEKYWILRTPHGTSHGTPYGYDSHVPLIFARTDFSRMEREDPVKTVDIAPTIAKYLSLEIPDYVVGKPLKLTRE